MKTEHERKSPMASQTKRKVNYGVERSRFRAVSEDLNGVTVRKLRGYAILFDVLGTPWRGSVWKEKISKSALDGVDLSSTPVLWDHNTAWVLGKSGKNARLEVDETGLFVEVTLGNTWFDDYVYDRVERELADGMSFWFDSKATIATDWDNKIDIIAKINAIYEVSILVFPAYDETLIIAEEMPAEPELDAEEEAKKNAIMKLIEQL